MKVHIFAFLLLMFVSENCLTAAIIDTDQEDLHLQKIVTLCRNRQISVGPENTSVLTYNHPRHVLGKAICAYTTNLTAIDKSNAAHLNEKFLELVKLYIKLTLNIPPLKCSNEIATIYAYDLNILSHLLSWFQTQVTDQSTPANRLLFFYYVFLDQDSYKLESFPSLKTLCAVLEYEAPGYEYTIEEIQAFLNIVKESLPLKRKQQCVNP